MQLSAPTVPKSKRVIILGSTGSIGAQAIDVVTAQSHLRAVGLAAGRNWQLLAEQARRVGAEFVAIADESAAEPLRKAVGSQTQVLSGPEAMVELIGECPADIVLSGVVGSCGLRAALATIEAGRDLAIANKETLVVAGKLVTDAAAKAGVAILPVDSEHSAIHQCLAGSADLSSVKRVIITASGGPFRQWPKEQIDRASVEQALNHPTWRMGRKITIDSATLMNKTLEVIEAHWLFGLRADQIDVVIHPESIVHSLVEFRDGNMLAQLGRPSMVQPIAYALNYPHRVGWDSARLDLAAVGTLTFEPVDRQKFPAIDLANHVLEAGQGAAAVLNGANEAAVEAYLAGQVEFGQIVPLVEQTLNKHAGTDESSLDAMLSADAWARREVLEAIDG